MISKLQELLDKLIWSEALSRAGKPGAIAASVLRHSYGLVRDFLTGQLDIGDPIADSQTRESEDLRECSQYDRSRAPTNPAQ